MSQGCCTKGLCPLVQADLRVVEGMGVALGRIARRQGQHQGGDLLADVGEILTAAGFGKVAVTR